MDILLADFIDEAKENLDSLEKILLLLGEGTGEESDFEEALRICHNLKGASGFVTLPRVERLLHAVESYLSSLWKAQESSQNPLWETLLKSVDVMRHIFKVVEVKGVEPHGDDAWLLAQLMTVDSDSLKGTVQKETEVLEAVKSPKKSSARFRLSLVESILAHVNELVHTRNELLHFASENSYLELQSLLKRLDSITTHLQYDALSLRMQPIHTLWSKFPRLVHDLSQELQKDIELILNGEDVEMDRYMLESLQGSLLHMIRNAADHGIEPASERIEQGKPSRGTIKLNARLKGEALVIQITDDGRGLCLQKIKDTLLREKIYSSDAIKKMSDGQIYESIFLPGFSTAESVSLVSGRGIGMDVVKTQVENLGGKISVQSEAGVGTTFRLSLPATLAIVEGFVVQAGAVHYVFPRSLLREIIPLNGRCRFSNKSKVPTLQLGRKSIPYFRLEDLFMQGQPIKRKRGKFLLVFEEGSELFGVMVDDIGGVQDVVVTPPSFVLKEVPGLLGSTSLGCGRVSALLDPLELYFFTRDAASEKEESKYA